MAQAGASGKISPSYFDLILCWSNSMQFLHHLEQLERQEGETGLATDGPPGT